MSIFIGLTTIRLEELASEAGISLIETAVENAKQLIGQNQEITTQ
jgi:hypothetical protein